MDEQITHLAHTDRHLSTTDLLTRVKGIITTQNVPVDVQEMPVLWQNDRSESRHRVIASLKDHAKSNLKMIFGVDYLGDWASIVMQMGMEPDRVKPPPHWTMPQDALFAFIGGALFLLIGFALRSDYSTQDAGTVIALSSMFAIVFGITRCARNWRTFQEQTARNMEEMERQRLRAEMARTYKVDDARLFCAAMQEVFQVVVDDIVRKGAEVVRVQGGHGGYFETPDQSQPVVRRTDAAQAEV